MNATTTLSQFRARGIAGIALVASLVAAGVSQAATPELQCQKGRLDAAARFAQCHQRVLAKVYGTGSLFDIGPAMAKCRAKYASTWGKLQAQASGSGSNCDVARFVDNGDGTVTDNLTGLQWEQKTTDASVQDVNEQFRLNQSGVNPTTNGTAYTSLISTLNNGLFAGPGDWRIPTLPELQTIMQQPCVTFGCVDPAFGPSDGQRYWSATAYPSDLETGWAVYFNNGMNVSTLEVWNRAFDYRVRAVRGGL